MAIYGYAPASTLEQNVTIQEDALRRAGCEVIRSEKVSGSSRAGRSELALLLQFLRHGDTLMVTRVDRLARSIKDFQDMVHELRAAGVTLRATEQPIDTSSAAGKASLDMLGYLPNSRPICVENGKWKGSLKTLAMCPRAWSASSAANSARQSMVPLTRTGKASGDGGIRRKFVSGMATAIFPTNSPNGGCSGGFMPCAGQARIVRAHCSIR